MCMFTQLVLDVSNTKIFARLDEGYQYLAYQMDFSSEDDVAMILPIPTPVNSGEDAIQFINFKKHDRFFEDLHQLFVEQTRSMFLGYTKGISRSMLKVHDVGNFKATFVPTLTDFDRVDKQFKFDDTVWDKLPQYKDWSFVVFKLKPGTVKVHPMVFKFPSRFTDRVYFPTMHIHDGEIHDEEMFNHKLYYQPEWIKSGDTQINGWKTATTGYRNFSGILKVKFPILQKEVNGILENNDHWIMI